MICQRKHKSTNKIYLNISKVVIESRRINTPNSSLWKKNSTTIHFRLKRYSGINSFLVMHVIRFVRILLCCNLFITRILRTTFPLDKCPLFGVQKYRCTGHMKGRWKSGMYKRGMTFNKIRITKRFNLCTFKRAFLSIHRESALSAFHVNDVLLTN